MLRKLTWTVLGIAGLSLLMCGGCTAQAQSDGAATQQAAEARTGQQQPGGQALSASEAAQLRNTVDELRAEVARLQQEVTRLRAQAGTGGSGAETGLDDVRRDTASGTGGSGSAGGTGAQAGTDQGTGGAGSGGASAAQGQGTGGAGTSSTAQGTGGASADQGTGGASTAQGTSGTGPSGANAPEGTSGTGTPSNAQGTSGTGPSGANAPQGTSGTGTPSNAQGTGGAGTGKGAAAQAPVVSDVPPSGSNVPAPRGTAVVNAVYRGKVSSASAKQVVIDTGSGTPVPLGVDAKTKVLRDGRNISANQLKKGERVRAVVDMVGEHQTLEIAVLPEAPEE